MDNDIRNAEDEDPVLVFDNSSTIKEWLTTEEAARYLSLSEASLRNMTSNGKIAFYKLGRRNRYRLPELRELLLAGKRGS